MAPAPEPLVSVLVRSTGRDTLAAALASVAAQTWPAIEVVVVNARGPGHPPVDPQGLARLRVVGGEGPLHRCEAANLALDSAAGELLVFLDDDDWFDPGHVAGLVAALRASPDAVAAFAGVRCVDPSGATVKVFDEPFDPVRMMVENQLPIHAVLFRRDTCEREPACRFDRSLDLYEDWDFWLQLAERGPFERVAAVTAGYRVDAASGFGVRTGDEAAAVRALDALLAKWRARWSPRALRDLVARTRLVERRLREVEALREQAAAREHRSALERDGARAALAARCAPAPTWRGAPAPRSRPPSGTGRWRSTAPRACARCCRRCRSR